jgi:hypothetical protein
VWLSQFELIGIRRNRNQDGFCSGIRARALCRKVPRCFRGHKGMTSLGDLDKWKLVSPSQDMRNVNQAEYVLI